MQYLKPSWNSGGRSNAKRSATSERLAVESLVAVANTSAPKVLKSGVRPKAKADFSGTKFQSLKKDIQVYLMKKTMHRASIAEISSSFKLPTDQLAELLLSAKTDGLVELTKTSKGTEAILIER